MTCFVLKQHTPLVNVSTRRNRSCLRPKMLNPYYHPVLPRLLPHFLVPYWPRPPRSGSRRSVGRKCRADVCPLVARLSLTVAAPPLRPRPEMRSERETRAGSFGPEGGAGCERLWKPVRGRVVARLGPRRAGSGLRVAAGRLRAP